MTLLRLLIGETQLALLDLDLAREMAERLADAFWPHLHPEDRPIFVIAIESGDTDTLRELISRYGLQFIWKPEAGADFWALRHPWRGRT